MLHSSSLLRHFGLQEPGRFESALAAMLRTEIADAAESGGWVAVVGAAGAGKTHLIGEVERALAGQCVFVRLMDLNDRTVRIASILGDLVLGLSDEAPKRSTSALSHQVVRLLGQAVVARRQRVCLVIDDAQRLHASTLTALKMLRERDFAGHRPLLSIILSGWPELAATIERRKDILYRTDIVRLTEAHSWMTLAERERYLEAVFGGAIDEEARLTIAARCRVPGEMDAFVLARMKEARAAGLGVVDARVVTADLAQSLQTLGVGLPELAREMGMSTTTAHRTVHGGEGSPHYDKARAAIQSIARSLTTNKAV